MSSRDPWLDNAKMTLVALVVVGHGWTLLPAGALPDQLYDFLYTWHMPAFVLVTGFLSRSFTWSWPRLWSLVHAVLVPYLVVETLLCGFRSYVGGEHLDRVYLYPHWPLWYLVALILWRLAAPVFRAVPGSLVLAVAISLASGFWDVQVLDLQRVLGFLPFFVLGLKATPARMELLRAAWVRPVAVATLAATLLGSRFLDAWAGKDWLYYDSTYERLGAAGGHALVVRAGLLAVGLLAALSFLALVSRTESWFTRLGSATLVVYLFHGFVVRGADYAGFGDWAATHLGLAMLVVAPAGGALALLLASRPVASCLEHLIDPFGWVQRRTRDAVDLSLCADSTSDLRRVGA